MQAHSWLLIAVSMTVGSSDAVTSGGLDRELFEAFVRYNLTSQDDEAGLYPGPITLKVIDGVAEPDAVSEAMGALANARTFPADAEGGAIIVAPQLATVSGEGRAPFVKAMVDLGFEENHAAATWYSTLGFPEFRSSEHSLKPCVILYPADNLAVVVSRTGRGVEQCLEDAAFWFAGVHIRFSSYAVVTPSASAVRADEILADSLFWCATGSRIGMDTKLCAMERASALFALP